MRHDNQLQLAVVVSPRVGKPEFDDGFSLLIRSLARMEWKRLRNTRLLQKSRFRVAKPDAEE